MRFTDEDLKRLKIEWTSRSPELASDKELEMLALLARLEAAERYAWAMDQKNGPVDVKYMDSARKAWRKACGK